MAKVAIVDTKPNNNNYTKLFGFEYDLYHLCSDPSIKTVRKKDIDIEFDPDLYDWVVLIGKDAFKEYTKKSAIMDYSGKVVNEKFIGVINPAMLAFKPEVEKLWFDSKENIQKYVSGEYKATKKDITKFAQIQDEAEAIEFLKEAIAHSNTFVAIDSETTGLYPRDGYVQGISISFKKDWGGYISCDCFTEEVTALFQELISKKTVVFHNAKFDIAFIEYHLGVVFKDFEDTMLLHYCLDENPGTHGLKQLALKHTEYGDYEGLLTEWINDFCARKGLLKKDFKWEFIPFEILAPYGAADAVVTLQLFSFLKPKVLANPKLNNVYTTILIPACRMLIKMQDNGVPFCKDRLEFGQEALLVSLQQSQEKLKSFKQVQEFIEETGDFNPNSPKQLRELLFDKVGLKPTGRKTGTRQDSTDKEVLKELANESPIPAEILNIRTKSKLKNTYLDKIIVNLDKDLRLRTNFNIHGTTSGRLSSSGKINMQQLPRDGSVVKGSIKARKGYKIVSVDLETAEVYVAAVLSGDKELQGVFERGEDFHGAIAKRVFNLKCKVSEVKNLFPELRQSAKTVTFSILYQAGAFNLHAQVNKYIRDEGLDMSFSLQDAEEAISNYFKSFPVLAAWLDTNKKEISRKGFTYSFFGRKRRLPNVKSDDAGTAAHAVRSGLNFLVQSPASDVNLLAAIDMQEWLDTTGLDALMFGLVHDSILAEVKEEHVEEYRIQLGKFIQKDRGMSIPNTPIKYDFEIGDDYSFGKFDKDYDGIFQLWRDTSAEHREALELDNLIEQRQRELAA